MSDYFSSQPFIVVHTGEATASASADGEGQGSGRHSGQSQGPTIPVGTPYTRSSGTTVHVSNTFNLNANLDNVPSDTILVSEDNIFFTVHYHRLITASLNCFGGLLTPGVERTREDSLTCIVPEQSEMLNIALHCVYELPCDTYNPSFECLSASLPTLIKYGLAPSRYLARGTPLYNTVLNYALSRPLETYTLAASYNLEDLAVAASGYTLHLQLHLIPQNLADKMGTGYLQRLHRLHGSRMGALKELLDVKLYPHVATPRCSIEQRQVVRDRLADGPLVVDVDFEALSRPAIESVMYGLVEAVSCSDCKESLETQIKEVATKWMLLERSI